MIEFFSFLTYHHQTTGVRIISDIITEGDARCRIAYSDVSDLKQTEIVITKEEFEV